MKFPRSAVDKSAAKVHQIRISGISRIAVAFTDQIRESDARWNTIKSSFTFFLASPDNNPVARPGEMDVQVSGLGVGPLD